MRTAVIRNLICRMLAEKIVNRAHEPMCSSLVSSQSTRLMYKYPCDEP